MFLASSTEGLNSYQGSLEGLEDLDGEDVDKETPNPDIPTSQDSKESVKNMPEPSVSQSKNISAQLTSNAAGNDSVFHSPKKQVSLQNIPKEKLSSLDGFSPHLETSTPKHEDSSKLITNVEDSPSRQHLDFASCKSDFKGNSNIKNETDVDKELTEIDSGLESILSSNEKPKQTENRTDKVLKVHGKVDALELQVESEEHHIKDFNASRLKEPVPRSKKSIDYDSLSDTINDVYRIESAVHHKKEFHANHLKQYNKPKTSDYESANSLLEESENYNLSLSLQTSHNFKHERKVAWHERKRQIVQGNYYGQAMHKDTSMLPILFEVSPIFFSYCCII